MEGLSPYNDNRRSKRWKELKENMFLGALALLGVYTALSSVRVSSRLEPLREQFREASESLDDEVRKEIIKSRNKILEDHICLPQEWYRNNDRSYIFPRTICFKYWPSKKE